MNDSAGVLTGPAIIDAVGRGDINIDPFDVNQINPTSIDLRLGDQFGFYYNQEDDPSGEFMLSILKGGSVVEPRSMMKPPFVLLDSKKKNPFAVTSIPEEGLVLIPGMLYLMHTREVVTTDKYRPTLHGKSSIGRLGICVHLTAAFGDPGFNGQYTLEVTCVLPVIIYPGMLFCQMEFETCVGEHLDYKKKGNYVGAAAMGPVPSRSWKQFL